MGLKENVIIGKLIPAGTGINRYRNIQVQPTEEARAAAYTIPSYEDQYYSPDFGQATGAAVPLDDYGYSDYRVSLCASQTRKAPKIHGFGGFLRLFTGVIHSPSERASARRPVREHSSHVDRSLGERVRRQRWRGHHAAVARRDVLRRHWQVRPGRQSRFVSGTASMHRSHPMSARLAALDLASARASSPA